MQPAQPLASRTQAPQDLPLSGLFGEGWTGSPPSATHAPRLRGADHPAARVHTWAGRWLGGERSLGAQSCPCPCGELQERAPQEAALGTVVGPNPRPKWNGSAQEAPWPPLSGLATQCRPLTQTRTSVTQRTDRGQQPPRFQPLWPLPIVSDHGRTWGAAQPRPKTPEHQVVSLWTVRGRGWPRTPGFTS